MEWKTAYDSSVGPSTIKITPIIFRSLKEQRTVCKLRRVSVEDDEEAQVLKDVLVDLYQGLHEIG